MVIRFLKAWLPVAAMCIVIFLFSQDANSGEHSHRVLRFLLSLVGADTRHNLRLWDEPFRKFAHIFVYLLLGALAYRGFAMGRRGYSWAAAARSFLFCAVYATTDEFHQSFVPGRGPAVRDVVLDSAAAALALFLIWLWLRARPHTSTQAA